MLGAPGLARAHSRSPHALTLRTHTRSPSHIAHYTHTATHTHFTQKEYRKKEFTEDAFLEEVGVGVYTMKIL